MAFLTYITVKHTELSLSDMQEKRLNGFGVEQDEEGIADWRGKF